jgi:hypothetical protein
MKRNPVGQAIANPAKNLLTYTFISFALGFATNAISNGVLVDKSQGQILIGIIILVAFLLIGYFTDISEWLSQFLVNFGIGTLVRDQSNASPLNRTFAGLIVIMSVKEDSPAERAIRHHWHDGKEPHLQHCWVICTSSSIESAQKMIAQFTHEGITQKVQFHYGNRELVNPHNQQYFNLLMKDANFDDPASDPDYILKLVDAIYADAESKGLDESKVIADYTGGTKTMGVGLVLACVSPKRHLQYINQKPDTPIMEVKISYKLNPLKSIS